LLHPLAPVSAPVAAAAAPVYKEGVAGCQENKLKCSEYF